MSRFQKIAFPIIFAVSAIALILRMLDVEGQIVFVVAAFAVAGLAWALGEATEQAGARPARVRRPCSMPVSATCPRS